MPIEFKYYIKKQRGDFRMKKVFIKDILKVTNGKLLTGNLEDECIDFSKDTREIKKDDTFVGIKGERFNSNLLYKDALDRGAKTCILQDVEISKEDLEKYKDKNIIIVDNTIEAIGKIAGYKRSLYNIPVIAVTGSVGKTSTKDIIASVVAQKYNVLKTQGNLNNDIGLPFTILGLKEHTALVVEMGMNHFGEIDYLTNIAKPTVAVITNIGTTHIGNLGSRENILKAKLEILNGLQENGTVIINNDTDLLNKWAKADINYKKITYGIEEKSNIMAFNTLVKESYSTYNTVINENKYDIEVPISGKHFIYNSLSSIAVGVALGIDMNLIQKGIKEFELTKKRMDLQKIKNNITVINDSYNASYDSMKAALEYLGEIKGNKKIAVLGDMLELGEYSEKLHRLVGKEVVKNKIDILITIGKQAKYIAEEAKKENMNKNIFLCATNKEAYDILKNKMEENDIILLKASNALNLSEILEMLKK